MKRRWWGRGRRPSWDVVGTLSPSHQSIKVQTWVYCAQRRPSDIAVRATTHRLEKSRIPFSRISVANEFFGSKSLARANMGIPVKSPISHHKSLCQNTFNLIRPLSVLQKIRVQTNYVSNLFLRNYNFRRKQMIVLTKQVCLCLAGYLTEQET